MTGAWFVKQAAGREHIIPSIITSSTENSSVQTTQVAFTGEQIDCVT